MNMHGHSNRNVIFICTTDQGYGDVNAGEHNHQRFGPVPEQFLYNPGEDILLSTEEEILRFYTENGRGVLLGRAVTVLRSGDSRLYQENRQFVYHTKEGRPSVCQQAVCGI